MNRNASTRPTIGLLTDWSESPYQTILRTGVVDAAEQQDVNLVCFVGGALDSITNYESQRNIVYDLVNKNILDGLVISSASIGHFISIEKMAGFCTRFCNIPITSIAMPIKNIPSILVDNAKGMYNLLTHLIYHHKYKKIAFIRGPENNPEAGNRFEIYKKSLKKYNLPYNPELVVKGDFIFRSGEKAVKTLLDERKADFDAVIASNDEMAFGALAELQARGIEVPSEIALAGFDDVEESRYYSPAFTTVRQPLYDQGRKAMEILLDLIKGKKVPDKVYLPTKFITRESCGCLSKNILEISVSNKKYEGLDGALLLTEFRERIIDTLQGLIEPREPAFPEKWAEKLFDSFYGEIIENKKGKFLHTLNGFLFSMTFSDNVVHLWQKILTIFRQNIHPCLVEQSHLFQAENLWNQARIIVADVTHRYESKQRLQAARKEQSMRDLSEKFITKIELEPLLSVIASEVPKVGINTCYLSLYESENRKDKARLILAFNKEGRITGKNEVVPFKSCELIPGKLNSLGRRVSFMVEGLFHGNDHLGFALFEIGPQDGRVYEMLRIRLSSALQGTLLFSQLKEQANNLEIEVNRRTSDLITTNEQLQLEIMERKHAEEELRKSNLELEQFAYIASHDLQEPLRMIGSFTGLLARRYKDKIDQNANEYIDFVIDGVNRMKGMINDLLAYSRVRTRAKKKEPIDFHEKLEDAIQALQFVIEEKKANITFDELPVLPADGSQIRQLFQNLLSNAIKFHGEKPPEIHIGIEDREDEFLFSISDNGIGMEDEYKENIFVMFKRLHTRDEYPGTGIGLAICKKIVDLHGGQIWVESKIGKGSTFFFTIIKTGDK